MSINKYLFKLIQSTLIIFYMVLVACNSAGHSHELGHDHDHDHPEEVGPQAGMVQEVTMTREQINNIELTYTALTPKKIRSMVRLTGRVELPPSGKAMAGSILEGKVTAVHVMAGSQVKKGQRLFTVQNLQIIDWQQELKMKQAELDFLIKDLERQKQLSIEELTAVKNYENALSEKLQQEAAIEALKAKLNALGLRADDQIQSTFSVLAPMSGFLQHLLVSNGQFIDASTPLAEIINNQHLHLHLMAFGSDVSLLDKDQVLSFFIQSRPDQILQAKILWINAMVNEDNNSYDVHAEIMDDHVKLSAGEFVEARVINQEQTLHVVPLSAVSSDKGLYYIFVKDDEHDNEVHYRKIQVRTGESDLGFIEILPVDPLPAVGDSSVVYNGAFFLLAESKKGEETSGHAH